VRVQLKTVSRIEHHFGFAGISPTTIPGLFPARFLKKFEVFENFASQFPEKGLEGKDTSERCRQIGTTCKKSSPFT